MNHAQEFLKTFFESNSYEEKNINSFWLVQQTNGLTGQPNIAIYTDETFENYKNYKLKYLPPRKERFKKFKQVKKILKSKIPRGNFYMGVSQNYKKAIEVQKQETERIKRKIGAK